jgi:hypothetical protein
MADHTLDVDCKVECKCGLKFDDVEQFDKHLAGCRIMKAESSDSASYNEERRQVLGLQKELSSITRERLNKLLKRLVSGYISC